MTSPQDGASRPPMRVAMIGLGDIAQKAYLPVLAATPGIDLLLCTRDRPTLDRLADAYRVPARCTSVDEVVAAGVEAAFVHAATRAHVDIVAALIEAGVHVYVDKPLADRLPDADRLVRLAGEHRRSLMVGFNRRYAPGYAALRDLPRDLVVMQKNRAGQADDPRRVVFDDFIHVVDTLRFLAPGDVSDVSIDVRVRGGLLEHVVLHLRGAAATGESGNADFTAIGIMSRVSGANEETCEVIGGGAKRRVVNLAGVVDYSGTEAVSHRGDWVPVARQRGIEQACQEFLSSVREGRLITADDALRTHALCEEIVAAAT
ncbi:Gfo/Idh/MocA family protein [Planotetraspora mira]|uniref:Oxidoreductase n=1 Tax=Planotetraspora mira TaxID=58121 RepID=A0A8J3TTU2_9ACTN|nr:Gfo/Idh/MocA family oxidoreductase [Planotetraspora mira]GII27105.1 oxidoreductase [Planotetraspora mira]